MVPRGPAHIMKKAPGHGRARELEVLTNLRHQGPFVALEGLEPGFERSTLRLNLRETLGIVRLLPRPSAGFERYRDDR